MKKVVFILLLVFSSYGGFSQNTKDTSVEKSVFGIQIGIIGIWAHNESKLSDQVTLRSEIGLGGVNGTNIVPILALEPRWYYNLSKRVSKGKRIDGNSGNYLSLRTSYHHFTSSKLNENDLNEYLITPMWGIRRNIGNHFNYELGAGAGVGYQQKELNLALNANIRIGYRF